MKKLPFERQVCFRSSKVSEVNRQNRDEEKSLLERVENETRSGSKMSTTSQNHEFSYQKISTQVLVVDILPLPAKYFRQFSQRNMLVKNKELWAIALKL